MIWWGLTVLIPFAWRPQESYAIAKICETRMNTNTAHLFLRSCRKNHDFVLLLSGNTKFQVYLAERTETEKARILAVLSRLKQQSFWDRIDKMTSFTEPFVLVHKILSKANVPISVYPLLIQALRNDINRILRDDFDAVLWEGARVEVVNMIKERCNADGHDSSGRKVNLLDRHQLMAFLVDPKSRRWRGIFNLGTNKAALTNEMIKLYIPLDNDGSNSTRQRMLQEFLVSHCNISFQHNIFISIHKILTVFPLSFTFHCIRNLTPSRENTLIRFIALFQLFLVLLN